MIIIFKKLNIFIRILLPHQKLHILVITLEYLFDLRIQVVQFLNMLLFALLVSHLQILRWRRKCWVQWFFLLIYWLLLINHMCIGVQYLLIIIMHHLWCILLSIIILRTDTVMHISIIITIIINYLLASRL